MLTTFRSCAKLTYDDALTVVKGGALPRSKTSGTHLATDIERDIKSLHVSQFSDLYLIRMFTLYFSRLPTKCGPDESRMGRWLLAHQKYRSSLMLKVAQSTAGRIKRVKSPLSWKKCVCPFKLKCNAYLMT